MNWKVRKKFNEKIEELRERMVNHKVVDDKPIVELNPKELAELLDFCEEYLYHDCDEFS